MKFHDKFDILIFTEICEVMYEDLNVCFSSYGANEKFFPSPTSYIKVWKVQ
jgi:hypothetical protein